MFINSIKLPIMSKLDDEGTLDRLKQEYLDLRRQTKGPSYDVDLDATDSPEFKDFERWLFSKANMKDAVKNYVTPMITTRYEEMRDKLVRALMTNFKKILLPQQEQ